MNTPSLRHLLRQITRDEKSNALQDKMTSYDEPLIQLVDQIILDAFQKKASDIHLEAQETCCRIRYRQQGILVLMNEIPAPLTNRIMTRLKVMGKLNIAEKRLPQDGRFQLLDIDIRISTCPTFFGEKIVLRLLNSNKLSFAISDLGLTATQQKLFSQAISQAQGMVLVTGPTGSGKTVTLYSALHYLNQIEKNISTVEDPIEIRLPGINQVNINTKIGLDFATILRAFLRQDPDIIMVGEIRDQETANIAIQAAQTGHLVLSTLHTNNAAETITRLLAMGIPAYNIAESISLVIAQRLVRRLCDDCKIPEKLLHYDKYVYRASHCDQCIHGYQSRFAIYELLPLTETLKKLIFKQAHSQILLEQAKKEGFVTLSEIAMQHVLSGVTSFAEINRILQL